MVQSVAGMEHSGFFFLEGQSFLRNEPAERYNGLQRNIAHETGHTWFYDTVGNSEFREGWIDEGICSHIASDELLYNNLESYKTVVFLFEGSKARRNFFWNKSSDCLKGNSRPALIKGLCNHFIVTGNN